MASQSTLSPRAARTRTALISAGFDLLAERPIDAIPIDDVVTKAGVAKGSFFNHFRDKQDFADALAKEVRREVEALVTAHNEGVTDPVERIAGGMKVAADFAKGQPARAITLLRSLGASTARSHPLNRGLRDDLDHALDQGLIRPQAREAGVLYWLGLCQTVIAHVVETTSNGAQAESDLAAFLLLGLTGLGVDADQAARISAKLLP